MMTVPAAMPVTAPDPEIVAKVVLLLNHDMPPVLASLRKVLAPVHTRRVPLIATGD